MVFQVGWVSVCFSTLEAGQRSDVCVCQCVSFQAVAVVELHFTHAARVASVPNVATTMDHQVGVGVESFAAGFTVVRLSVCVTVSVIRQSCLQREGFSTELARVGFFLGMRPRVNFQGLFQFECLVAHLTFMRPFVRVCH